jgi:Na+/H+-dicarboxylate symporter
MIVRWILWFLPLGVFALVFLFTREVGATMIGFVGTYVAMMCILAVVVTLLLYPVTVLAGRVPVGRFAWGAAPAQLVAMSTRSSMASLPALVQGGREHLRLSPAIAGMALPFSVSVLRMSAVISAPFNLLYLAHVFGVPLSGITLASSLIAMFLLSFSTPGIPGAGPTVTLPVYIAAGIPIEGIVMLGAAEVVPDIFKTVLNVTGHMSAATILARPSRADPGVAPEAEPATA